MSSQEHNRSLDGFIEGLEKRARAARAISIAITIFTITLAAFTLFFTIREIRKRINLEQATLNHLREERQKTQDDLARLKQEYDLTVQQRNISRTALSQLPQREQEALLKKANEIHQTDSSQPKVYLQILDNKQRDQANALANRLKNEGFEVQGVEWVRLPVTLKQTQVKYFRPEFADEAQKITALLKRSGIQATPVGINTAAGQIEVWFAADAFPGKAPERPPDKTVEPPKASSDGSLIGQLYDADTKTPIQGVKISFDGHETMTDAKGAFRMDGLPATAAGVLVLSFVTAVHKDYDSARKFVRISANQTTDIQGWALHKRSPATVQPRKSLSSPPMQP